MAQTMNKLLLYIVCSLFTIPSFAQIVRLGEKFTAVSVIEDKVVFIKEIPLKRTYSTDAYYRLLKNWAITNYGKDPFISSVRHDPNNNEFIAKSRIELLLPANSKGVREKMVMRYRISGSVSNDKCVLEITDISYLYENLAKDKLLPRVIRAEEFITDKAVSVKDNLQEFKINTRKSTLFFLDELCRDFESKFGY